MENVGHGLKMLDYRVCMHASQGVQISSVLQDSIY